MNQTEILTKIIRGRRSMFPPMYSDAKIAEEDIELILENANWAPNHKLTEPWRFHVMTGDKLQQMSVWAGEWYKKNVTGDKYSPVKHKKIMSNPLKSSHVIAICMRPAPDSGLPEWEEVAALSMAVQNMWLTAASLGIGSYWSSPGYIRDAGELLDLSEGERCLGWFYMGMPQPGASPQSKRTPIGEKVTWYK